MKLDRKLLAKYFGKDPKLVSQFEDLAKAADEGSTVASSTAQDTKALQDATMLTLSSNETLTNERVLRLSPGLKATDDGKYLTITVDKTVARVKDYSLRFLPSDDATLFVQEGGTVMVRETPVIDAVSAASDAAAATAGVPVGGLYHVSGVVHVRLA